MSQKSHQILISTGLGILVGAGLTKLYERIKHQHEKTKMNFTSSNNAPTQGEAYEKEIGRQLACNVEFFGSEALEKIRNSFVIIVGIGGVGSHVLSALARAGVKKIRIIDFDRITLSSLNRHAFATRKNVGISKVECCINYVKSIFPHIEIEAIEEALSFKNLERLLNDNPSYVIDCIDNIDSKTDLVEYCVKNHIKIIAACGAGMKADPTRLQIKDISDSTYDDLSRALRLKLKKKGVNEGVPVVYSTERTERKLLPLKEHQEVDPDNFRLLPGYRVRIIPVFSAMPALVGYSIASYALCDLAGHPYEPHVIDETKSNNYQKLYQVLQHREKKAKTPESDIDFDQEDIYILARIFQWKCFLTGNKTNLELVRWDPKKKATLTNLVLLHVPQAQKHLLLDDISSAYDEDTHKRIQEKFTLAEGIKNTKNPVYTH